MKPLQFRVKFKFDFDGKIMEGIESEASWYYLDQRGKFYSNSPMKPIMPCDMNHQELTPLIKIGEKYLSVDDIEKLIYCAGDIVRGVYEENKSSIEDGDSAVLYADEIESLKQAADLLNNIFDK